MAVMLQRPLRMRCSLRLPCHISASCAAYTTTLAQLQRDLPAMALLEPAPAFMGQVLEATTGRRRLQSGYRERMAAAVEKKSARVQEQLSGS